jgi:hypothetical protein
MTIFRGEGGGGDATSDVEVNLLSSLSNTATAAATSATASANTATAAASTATTQASLATSNGATQVALATTQAGNASTSASSASTSAGTATTQAGIATTQASNAATSATNAANSATLAASFTPSQTGNSGKFLTTNGTATSWATVSATNLAGGSLGSVPYQLLSGTTAFLAGNTTTTPQFITSTGVAGLATAPTLTGSTGSGNVVLSTSPTLVTPALGTPSSGTLTNCTFPTLNQNTTGTASNVTGTVAVGNGGTGATTFSANSVLLGNNGSALQVVAPSTSGNVLTSNGTTWVSQSPSGGITRATAVSVSGTSVDFTGIPSTVKRITLMFSGVSTNGASNYLIRLGTGGTPTTSGYVSAAGRVYTTTSTQTSTAGFILGWDNAAFVSQGILTFANLSGNTWVGSGTVSSSAFIAMSISLGGTVSLGGVLDMVRITTVNGTDTFDAGSVNILYE